MSRLSQVKKTVSAQMGDRFLDRKEREGLVAKRTALWIHNVNFDDSPDNKYGARYVFILSVGSVEAEKVAMSLSRNPYRDAFAAGVADAIKEEGPLGPVFLSKRPTNNGNDAYEFVDEDEEPAEGEPAEEAFPVDPPSSGKVKASRK